MNKHFRVERNADAMVVHFLDERIHADVAIASLGKELYAVAERPDCLKLVLNFSDVEFLASAMLGKLVAVKKKIAEKNGVFRLCAMSENIRLMF
ncbi:MAG: STAS domain-containing protein, partial [Thermoguttaceae bacterium]